MISQELIEGLDIDLRRVVTQALVIIVDSGIIDAQLAQELAQLASGVANEDDAKLAERIKTYRLKAGALLSFKSLGESYKEQNDD